jgi:hypothetical protein
MASGRIHAEAVGAIEEGDPARCTPVASTARSAATAATAD